MQKSRTPPLMLRIKRRTGLPPLVGLYYRYWFGVPLTGVLVGILVTVATMRSEEAAAAREASLAFDGTAFAVSHMRSLQQLPGEAPSLA